ncbi:MULTISPECIES: hypothetical protein [unclassified Brenneria]|uniref:hypothetical protein n=1 Tax=unclassified Brenneria TaxID=2634434 RepID=UPI0015516826|nr:hypothetical protein [Brenneria sp. hezel4-2-4]MEE3651765.1 hypothetical protein [Brenneria sp. HEZEL_4_2_4]NPD01721.1 hypothetical protein [Brenneria sp. hezel4-2-4]
MRKKKEVMRAGGIKRSPHSGCAGRGINEQENNKPFYIQLVSYDVEKHATLVAEAFLLKTALMNCTLFSRQTTQCEVTADAFGKWLVI